MNNLKKIQFVGDEKKEMCWLPHHWMPFEPGNSCEWDGGGGSGWLWQLTMPTNDLIMVGRESHDGRVYFYLLFPTSDVVKNYFQQLSTKFAQIFLFYMIIARC
jgi:hypothetical protein